MDVHSSEGGWKERLFEDLGDQCADFWQDATLEILDSYFGHHRAANNEFLLKRRKRSQFKEGAAFVQKIWLREVLALVQRGAALEAVMCLTNLRQALKEEAKNISYC